MRTRRTFAGYVTRDTTGRIIDYVEVVPGYTSDDLDRIQAVIDMRAYAAKRIDKEGAAR